MSISDLMEAMAKAGAPMEAILLAVRAIEAKDDEIASRDAEAAEKRAKDAARKKAKRHADAVSTEVPENVHGHSTDTSRTFPDTPLPSPSPSFPPDPQTNPTPAHPREDTPRARKADDFPKPEWADPQVWADFMLNRKRKRMTNSATAYRGFLRDIEKHTDANWPPGRLLEHAAAKGWASINSPDEQDNRHELSRRTTLRPSVQQSSRAARLRQSLLDVEAERGDLGDYPPAGRALSAERWHQ